MSPDSKSAQADFYCLWESEDREFEVGIIGAGPGFRSFLDIVFNESYREFLPVMRLAAVAEPNPASPSSRP